MPVEDLHVGMYVREANGSYGEITGWHVVSGSSTMYNLEVQQDHTFTIGDGQWVVHNDCRPRYGPVTEKIARSGTLTDLWHKGYNMDDHFVDAFLDEKGLSSGDIENILKNGYSYRRYIDTFIRITGKTLGRKPRTFSIVYNQFSNELHTIFQTGVPQSSSEYEPVPNPFAP